MNASFAEQSRPADSRVVLCRGNCEFTVADVLAAGWFLGEMESPWREMLKACTCQERANELELEAEEETLTSMSEDFRYERELLTVEEIERWLVARDLTEDDFNAYLVRRYWRQNPPEAAEDDATEEGSYLEASPELQELLRAELWLSG